MRLLREFRRKPVGWISNGDPLPRTGRRFGTKFVIFTFHKVGYKRCRRMDLMQQRADVAGEYDGNDSLNARKRREFHFTAIFSYADERRSFKQ